MSLLLLYPNITLGNGCLNLNLAPCGHVPSQISQVLTLNQNIKGFKPHACTRHVVIIVFIVNIAMLTWIYSIMSYATLILSYYASMLTLHNSLISHAPASVILQVRVYITSCDIVSNTNMTRAKCSCKIDVASLYLCWGSPPCPLQKGVRYVP